MSEDCGCTTVMNPIYMVPAQIEYCPLHKAAPDMLILLEDVNNFGGDDSRLRDKIRRVLLRVKTELVK